MTRIIISFAIAALLTGCSTIYYSFWESFGVEKRELLSSEIEEAQDDQAELQDQFKSTLDRIRSEYDFDGGDLEGIYDRLSSDYERADARYQKIVQQVNKVDDIADDLFVEWQAEAQEISNRRYRQDSLKKRQETMKRYRQLKTKMDRVTKSAEPVLTKLNDQVLYLKHNLNAKAVGAFKGEFERLAKDIDGLIKDIDRSVAEADEFIATI